MPDETASARKTVPTTPDEAAAALVADLHAQAPVRAGSLLITLFGDAIAPRGGAVWLTDLLALMEEAFGLNRRLVRTAATRLVKDGWLESESHGRRALYRLSPAGRRRFDSATRRIYGGPPRTWSGRWCTVIVPPSRRGERDHLRRDLEWSGFAAVGPGVWVHPAPDPTDVANLAAEAGNDSALILDGESVGRSSPAFLADLTAEAWPLDDIAARYRAFLDRFTPVAGAFASRADDPTDGCAEAASAVVRTLLIHSFRRVILRDPMLPPAFLPADWPGFAAYRLTQTLYRALAAPADRYLGARLTGPDGPLPAPGADFATRFGGL